MSMISQQGDSGENGFKEEKDPSYMYGELRLEMYIGYGLLHREIIDVGSQVMNEIILGCMIDLQICEKQLCWNMELYRVFLRIVVHTQRSNWNLQNYGTRSFQQLCIRVETIKLKGCLTKSKHL